MSSMRDQINLQTQISKDAVTKIVWQSQTPFFMSCSMDGTVRKWDSRTGECLNTWKGHQEGVLDFVLSPDNSRLITASDDHVSLVFSNA
jgi:ribosome assembly protein SQT1